MSPERCLNKELTTSSDLYSLGVLVFQMITGRLPYEGTSPIELIKSIVSDPPARISAYRTDIPADVERLVAYTIEKRPGDRPGSAAEVAELMQRLLDGETLWKDESGLAVSLETYRHSVSTPSASLTPHTSELGRMWRAGSRISRQWEKMPKGLRLALAGGTVVAVSTLAGFGTAFQLNRDYALDTVRGMEVSTKSWYRSAVVADFNPESQGVSLARIYLEGYRVSASAFLGQNLLALELTAAAPQSRQASALCVLDLAAQSAWLGITPKMGEGSDAAFTLLSESGGFLRAEGAPEGYLFTRTIGAGEGGGGAALFASLIGDGVSQPPQLLFRMSDAQRNAAISGPSKIVAAAIAPSGKSIVMAVAREAGVPRSSLVRYTPGDGVSGGRTEVLATEGAPIEWISTTPRDSVIRYLRRTSETTFQLWGIDGSGGPGASKLIFDGSGTLSMAGVDASGRYLAVADGSGIRLIDLSQESQAADLGPGTSASWHPDGEYIIVTVPDRRGRLQLWAVQAQAPYGRAQLTFLSEGVEGASKVSPDGRWALVPTVEPDHPAMAIVDVSRERLAKLNFGA